MIVMAQSVLDELEFLDISAGIKRSGLEDDDFDYIYHLPHANPIFIIPRDPFNTDKSHMIKATSLGQLSMISKHSVRAIRGMLDPSILNPGIKKKVSSRRSMSKRSDISSKPNFTKHTSTDPSRNPTIEKSVNKKHSFRNHILKSQDVQSLLDANLPSTGMHRKSSIRYNSTNWKDNWDESFDEKEELEVESDYVAFEGPSSFKALPRKVTQYVSSVQVAFGGMVLVSLAVFQVIYSTILESI
jgi:hypothetical protein